MLCVDQMSINQASKQASKLRRTGRIESIGFSHISHRGVVAVEVVEHITLGPTECHHVGGIESDGFGDISDGVLVSLDGRVRERSIVQGVAERRSHSNGLREVGDRFIVFLEVVIRQTCGALRMPASDLISTRHATSNEQVSHSRTSVVVGLVVTWIDLQRYCKVRRSFLVSSQAQVRVASKVIRVGVRRVEAR